MTLSAPAFDWVCATVEREAAIVLEPGKEYLVESRLTPLARSGGHPTVTAFVDKARTSADRRLREDIVEALTTNETSWFRDNSPFQVFSDEIMPYLKTERAAARQLRIWSAACSTGQEPYSLAMLLNEGLLPVGWRSEIIATDLSPAVLRQAEAGVYSQIEINRGLPANRLVRHFTRAGTKWAVNDDLKRMISFRKLNLAQPFPPMGQFDVIFLRNVLIYFSIQTRREILARMRAVCRPDGFLLLGGAETILGMDEHWQRFSQGRVSLYRPR
ncbi:protein-glutamate O-methyltransferase CheR [Jatrophihabitans telluris]|uniref:protein-glutamate O-methyltransferase n=1 Tax=Jatrophihabitans telluris TaxID=2038343 RepID=A0ABY4R1D9_9ACTN|nr:protein-glutamate O-methyltransferase CheR [Jatrophihabitans telluris]UQX89588.1 protein-glutamate O-methyltransferase CheR [Jatrophihabitans telluris]